MYIPKPLYIALSSSLVGNPMAPIPLDRLQERINDLDKLNFCPEADFGIAECAVYDPRPGECIRVQEHHIESVVIAPNGWPSPDGDRIPLICKLYPRTDAGCDDTKTNAKLIDWIVDQDIGKSWYDDVGYYQCSLSK